MEELLKELRRKSVINVLWVTAVTTLAAIVLFVFNRGAVSQLPDMSAGGANLDDIAPGDLDNTIANSEIRAAYDCFAEYNTGSGRFYEYYVIPYNADGEQYIGVRVSKEKAAKLDAICSDTWAYLMGKGDATNRMVPVKGNVRPMDSDEADYFENWFREMDFSPEEIEESVVKYVLVDGMFANDISPVRLYLMSACGVLVFLVGAFLLIRACTGGHLKAIRRDFAQSGTYTEDQIVTDYKNAYVVNKNVRIGRLFTYDTARFAPRAYLNSNIAWLYQHHMKRHANGLSAGSNDGIVFFSADGAAKSGISLEIKKKDCDRILTYYADNFPHIVIGYSDELKDLYFHDRNAFLGIVTK